MGLVEGAKALVTGAGSGIGRATALRLAAEGAAVAACDVHAERAEAVAAEVRAAGGSAVAFAGDVRVAGDVETWVRAAAEAMGGLTVLVNNAGLSTLSPLEEMLEEEWDLVLDTCLKGVYLGIRFAVPHLRAAPGGGRIVSTASISGLRPSAGEAHYAAAKAGVMALTRSAAIELGPEITVNAVAPGTIATALTEAQLAMEVERDRIVAHTPAGRTGSPEDVADVIVFLASPLARFVTGETIAVDGGLSLRSSGVDTALETVSSLGIRRRAGGSSPQAGVAVGGFASREWLDAVAERVAADDEFAGRAVGADVALQLFAGEDAFGVVVRDGALAEVWRGTRHASDVTVTADPDTWRRILTGDLDPAKAMTMQKLSLDGDMDKLTAAAGALLRLLEVFVEVPASWE